LLDENFNPFIIITKETITKDIIIIPKDIIIIITKDIIITKVIIIVT
jgi:hypothetical protein